MSFNLQDIVRPKIYNLKPYRCARDDFTEGILLDANENASGPIPLSIRDTDLNRYPDPHQVEFKTLLAGFRNRLDKTPGIEPLTEDNLCLGVGSDECIDSLIRACCRPEVDKILTLPPTYSMYSVCANINDVEIVECPLITEDNSFQMNVPEVLSTLKNDPKIKLLFITSPGNPTGKLVNKKDIEFILENWTNGLVVVDEAYIDFADAEGTTYSMAKLVTKYPNLTVLQTLSKSFGLAGIRLGVTFASEEFSSVLNAMKAPYNISSLTSKYAIEAVQEENLNYMIENARNVNQEKHRLLNELISLDYVNRAYVGGLDANFIMVRINNGDNELAKKLYLQLATNSKVVIRFRGNELGCTGCLRITVGTKKENDALIKEFKAVLYSFVK
ncbi:hypothetical protein Kpol_1039p22 [Vanderwaltozyma polyspora DSM 70294]|uniref:histidinol-phosphate transaminase n=1 Tax=Vanderwaltozyma polyspora (strain ATCC 22028 / DSM 70294 / BCRC 21397 / CBS 2163 / NBRC 10782 / NRRL Y-8283 / UCD 57-17) TaxID=436907 RepID=A7THE9_VANPO|nr:uncharacterized protein Kpol_1039p22 [Vanderwaltozyma polyspora DSM 70294]EDO18273.1 hypothetical protein Kpol_1039p22 [Vanderwaltozyma polyspora DSM 70294]